ncbi:MAG: spermidine/putrescine ABC transporter substrate-binding protein [Lachnospiraceae bacterium]|nr:spermidine/putrescine ABC transporter substrate-binding protein [Lachnospiraceae bacterium]
MKKIAAILLGIMMVAGVLTGCGKNTTNDENGANQTTQEAAQTAEATAESTDSNTTALSGELNLYTWDGMFPQEVLDGFEEETGVKINYSNFDYDEDMLAKLEETKGGDYDLVIADDYIIELAIKEGLVQKLNKEQIPNFGNINPLFQSQFYDATNEYTVPYGSGIPLIVYDKEAVGFEIKSYEDLWNPALEDNLAIVGNYRVIDGITLKTLGESFNTEDLDTIQKAGDKLLELAPNIRLISDSNTQDYIVSGEVSAAFLYTSQVTQALEANPDLSVCYPSEGLGFGIMAGFIPSQAPNADAANAFLNYILQPEVSAKCFESIGYYCTTKAAEEFISPELKDTLVVPDTVTEGEIIQNISQEAEDLHSEIWKKFQEACD